MTDFTAPAIPTDEQADLRQRLDEAQRVERDLFFRLVRNVPNNDGRGRHIALLALAGLVARVISEMHADDQDDAIEALTDMVRLKVDSLRVSKRSRSSGPVTVVRH